MLTDARCGSAGQGRPQSLTKRFERLPGAALIEELRIERGARGDYQQLASFHYKSGRPSAVTAVYRMVHRAPTVVGRDATRASQSETPILRDLHAVHSRATHDEILVQPSVVELEVELQDLSTTSVHQQVDSSANTTEPDACIGRHVGLPTALVGTVEEVVGGRKLALPDQLRRSGSLHAQRNLMTRLRLEPETVAIEDRSHVPDRCREPDLI